jgi:hypothetical protein
MKQAHAHLAVGQQEKIGSSEKLVSGGGRAIPA